MRPTAPIGLARAMSRVTVRCAAKQPYVTTRSARHFRTPSPRGQPDLTPRLSTSFSQCKSLIRRDFAGFSTAPGLPLPGPAPMSCTRADQDLAKKETEQCTSGHAPSWRPRRSPHVATRLENKRSSARARARQQRSFSTEARSPGRSWALRETCFIAGPTPASATDRLSKQPAHRTRVTMLHNSAQLFGRAGFFALRAPPGALATCHKRTPTCSRRS